MGSPDYKSSGTFQTAPETLSVMRHTGVDSNYSFKTSMYLPVHSPTVKAAETDVQSIAFSKDDRYLFVMHLTPSTKSNDQQVGWVDRYDWQGLMNLGVSKNGMMDIVRQATTDQLLGRVGTSRAAYANEAAILKCIKFGPHFTTGHAQSLALNPKTNEMWFIKAYKDGKQATVARLNQTTLTPDATVNFTLKSTLNMGSVLTFDKNGNAYFWSRTQTAWPTAPAGTAKIYKGTISTAKVKFALVMQGIQMAPGVTPQSIAYNSVNDRLYLVADSSIFSVPVSKLGHLKTSDVSATNFNGQREFESLTFMHQRAAGYLLTNRGPSVMGMSTNK